MIGVDTPETVKPSSPVECFGPEASAATKALLPAGTPVRLVRDVEAKDRYDRELFYVYRARDGLFVSGDLCRRGSRGRSRSSRTPLIHCVSTRHHFYITGRAPARYRAAATALSSP